MVLRILIPQWWSRNYWDTRLVSTEGTRLDKNSPNYTPFNITPQSGWERIRVVAGHIGDFGEYENRGFIFGGYNVWNLEGITPYFIWIGDLKTLTVGELNGDMISNGLHAHLICLSY